MGDAKRPVFTQRLTMALDGEGWTTNHYEIDRDGVLTGIRRSTRTNGSPQYQKTVDCFLCGADEFDILATKGVGLVDWLIAHSENSESTPVDSTGVDR